MKHAVVPRVLILLLLIFGLLPVGRPQAWAERPQQNTMLEQMLAARERQVQITPLSHTFGAFSMETAYYIQTVPAREVAKTAGSVTGYKVAYASKAAQKQFGMKEPAGGHSI